ncbi:MAG TPA: hypothetical protein VFU88_04545 [Ktedonobacterales bacterium]|nr:hypothetical protein [Ktedonobacterales bacterium]
MSPSPMPPAPPQLPAPSAQPPGAYPPQYPDAYPAPGTQPYPAVAPPPTQGAPQPPSYIPEPLHRPSRFWRMVKWPLRQLFKALILTGRAAKAHKAVALLIVLLVALIGGGTYGFYRLTHPADAITVQTRGGNTGGTGATQPNTPFTVQIGQPPLELPDSVTNALYAFKTYDAQRLWQSFDPAYQQYSTSIGLTQGAWQQQLDTLKSQGITFDQFRETGGFVTAEGSYYTFTVLYRQGQQGGVATMYFAVDPNGAISNFEFLHPQPQSTTGA